MNVHTLQPRRSVTDPLVRVVFEEIESELGFQMIPNVFRVMATMPEVLDATWCQMRAALLHGKLRRSLKEMIGLTVSIVNGTHYTRSLCLQSLTRACVDLDTLALVAYGNVEGPGLTRRDSAVLSAARVIALRAGKLVDSDWTAIQDSGLEYEETLEIAAVVDLFTSIDRFAEVARVPVDLW